MREADLLVARDINSIIVPTKLRLSSPSAQTSLAVTLFAIHFQSFLSRMSFVLHSLLEVF